MIQNNPIRNLLQQHAVFGRAAHWLLKLMEFDIKSITQKALKGQARVELLRTHHALPPNKFTEMLVLLASDSTPHRALYFDGATLGLQGGAEPHGGVGVVLME